MASTSLPRSAAAARDDRVGAYAWTVVVLLALASIIAYIDRVNLSVAVVDPTFKDFFGLDDTDRGMANSAFFWTYAALQIPAGWVVDRYGSKHPIAWSFLVWSLLTAATSLVTGFHALFLLRLALGVAEAVIHPASMRWIRFHFPESKRGLAIGLFMSGSKFGPAIGSTLAAWLIETYDWRVMFLTVGLGSLIWLVPWFLIVRPDRVSEEHAAAAAEEHRADDVPMGVLLANPILWGTIVATFCYMYFVYFCLTWMPSYFSDARGLSLKNSGYFTTFSFAGMAVVSILAGYAADRIIASGRDAVMVRKSFTIAGFLIASTVLLGASAQSLETALFFSIFSLSGLGLATPNYWALTQTLIPGGSIGRIVGIQNFAASSAGIVAPILTGWMVEETGSYTAPIQTVGLFIALGIACYLFAIRRKYAERFSGPLNG
jgi:ACS family D-galactonate transporter-like MFS transporter